MTVFVFLSSLLFSFAQFCKDLRLGVECWLSVSSAMWYFRKLHSKSGKPLRVFRHGMAQSCFELLVVA